MQFPWSKFALAGVAFAVATALSGAGAPTLEPRRAANEPRIVFLRLTAGYWQVWVMDSGGANSRQLTSSPVDKHSPSWCSGNDVVRFYNAIGESALVDVVHSEPTLQSAASGGSVSLTGPEGTTLPFDVDVSSLFAKLGVASVGVPNCDGGRATPAQIKEVRVPAWMPEGKALVVRRSLSEGRVPVYDIDLVELSALQRRELAGRGNLLADSRRVVSSAGWLAYVAGDRDQADVFVAKPGETGSQPLTDFAGHVGNPSFSLDGRWLVFEADVDGTTQIFQMLANGEARRRLTHDEAPSRSPVFSLVPEGTRR